MNRFTDSQVLEIRKAEISFDPKLDALARLVKSRVENKGPCCSRHLRDKFYEAGYTHGNLVDTIMVIGDKTITHYLHAITDVRWTGRLRRSFKAYAQPKGLGF